MGRRKLKIKGYFNKVVIYLITVAPPLSLSLSLSLYIYIYINETPIL